MPSGIPQLSQIEFGFSRWLRNPLLIVRPAISPHRQKHIRARDHRRRCIPDAAVLLLHEVTQIRHAKIRRNPNSIQRRPALQRGRNIVARRVNLQAAHRQLHIRNRRSNHSAVDQPVIPVRHATIRREWPTYCRRGRTVRFSLHHGRCNWVRVRRVRLCGTGRIRQLGFIADRRRFVPRSQQRLPSITRLRAVFRLNLQAIRLRQHSNRRRQHKCDTDITASITFTHPFPPGAQASVFSCGLLHRTTNTGRPKSHAEPRRIRAL